MERKEKFNMRYREKIESGEYKVETVDGRQVRIVCWDAHNPYRENDIVALATSSSGEAENILRYYSNGHLISDSANIGNKDLVVMIPDDDERIKKIITDSVFYQYGAGAEYKDVLDYLDNLEKQKEQNKITIEQVYKEFITPEKLKDAKTKKYIRAQLLWELMHNGIITEVDYQYLTDDNRKPWTEEEYLKAYRKGFDVSEQLKQKEQKPVQCIDFDNEFENQVSHLIASVLNGEHEYNEGFIKYVSQSLLGYAKSEMKPEEWSEDKYPKNIETDAVMFCFDKGFNITPYQARTIAKHYYELGLKNK